VKKGEDVRDRKGKDERNNFFYATERMIIERGGKETVERW